MKAPFSEEQVKSLNAHQNNSQLHPYTCNREFDECEVRMNPNDYTKNGILIATTEGWICPCGKYKQGWAH